MHLIGCSSCGTQLKVPDDVGGRRFKCPKCGGMIVAAAGTAPPAIAPGSQEDEGLAEPPRPKRKKKKKKGAKRRSDSRVPQWAWWWGSLAVAASLTVAALVGIDQGGYHITARFCAVRLMFALPISIIIFALSLLISNSFGAGVELVEFGTLIPKSLLLVLLASIVGLMWCVGPFIAIGVWFIGAMIFFGLEAWETKVLVGINFVLGAAMWLFLIGILASRVTPAE